MMLRQKAEAINDQSQEDQQEDIPEEEEYDDELDRGDEDDEDFGENRTTGESDVGNTLSSTKLTQQDYAKRSQSAKVKKGKYGVTVPQPFGFDMRDKSKTKSITQRKFEEMIAEKRVAENNLIKHQFRSKPIPPSVLIPRF